MTDTERINKITAILSEYEQCQESAPAYYLRKIMAVILDDEEDDGK